MLYLLAFRVRGVWSATLLFFSLSQRKGNQFGFMSGDFILTLLFKETFGEYVLKDSAKTSPVVIAQSSNHTTRWELLSSLFIWDNQD